MNRALLFLGLVFALGLAGCEEGITSDAQPIVSVLKQDGSCFARIAGEPIDSTLGVAGTCPYRGDSRLIASIDMLEVVVDYGADVPFSGTTTAPRPEILVTVDGVESDVAIEISDEFRVGDRAYFIATFRAPPETSSDIRISAHVNAGFQTIVPEVLTSIQPSVALSLLECPPGPLCTISGAVGSAHITLAVPGTVPQLVTIHSYLDGVPQPDPIPPVRTFPANGRTEAITAVPVPAAPDDTTWRLTAQLGGGPVAEVSTVILAPTLVSRLTCGTTCALASGDPVGLEILAPAPIRPLEAFVTTRLDGSPQLVNVRVPLEQRADGTALGLLGLTAPAGSGSWQIDVTVAGYAAPTLVTTVQ
jgi:hypothetical protein